MTQISEPRGADTSAKDYIYSKSWKANINRDALNVILQYYWFHTEEAVLQYFIKNLDISIQEQQDIWNDFCKWMREIE